MRKLIIILLSCVMGVVSSCYDDTDVWKSVMDHETRIEDLEIRCNQMNTNISSLQSIVNALQNNDYVTGVTKLTDNGKEVGFKIQFSKSDEIFVYHGTDGKNGQDGKDAIAPVIGVRADSDGLYYWTLNDQWILNDEGNKIPTTGTDGHNGAPGQDGITPKLKIEDDYWHISYDNGNTWSSVGKAAYGSVNSIFEDIYEENDHLCFVLSDGTIYKIPMTDTDVSSLDIVFDVEQGLAMVPDALYRIDYTVLGGDEKTIVRVVMTDGPVVAIVKPETATTGHIAVSVSPFPTADHSPDRDDSYFDGDGDVTYGDLYNSLLSFIVSVSDGRNNNVVKSINITEGVLESVQDAYQVSSREGVFTAQVNTNADYLVSIPKNVTWVSQVPSVKSAMRIDDIEFHVQANEGEDSRTANIHLVNDIGSILETIVIVQNSELDDSLPDISLHSTEIEFNAFSTEQYLTFVTNRDWEIKDYAPWITLSHTSGKASREAQSVKITVQKNDYLTRETEINIFIDGMSKAVNVIQTGALIYYNDFDKTVAENTYGSGSSWPYLNQFDGWQNQIGQGAVNVTYAYSGISARANSTSNSSYSDYEGSGSNNMFFGKSAYIAICNIALGGTTDIALSFGTEKYSYDNGSIFNNSEFHVYLSNDGNKWVELKDYTFAGGTTEGRWNLASSVFSVPAGTESLSICMAVDVASSYRMDDLKLEVSDVAGTSVDFSKGVEMDFTSSEGGGSSTSEPETLVSATIAEFLAAAESSDTWYKLTGEIISIAKEDYGNFTIKDSTGEVYIYGMTNIWVGFNDQSFSKLGLKVGDTVTLGTLRTSYKGTPQGGGSSVPAYYISHIPG